jgi:hypothetical protein
MLGPLTNSEKTAMVACNKKQLPKHLMYYFDVIKNGDEVAKIEDESEDWARVVTQNGYSGLFAKDNLDSLPVEKMKLPAVDCAPLFVEIAGWILVIAPGGPAEAV